MYSVVLMMALTTGTDAVDFGHRNRCHGGGGYGCYGGSAMYGGYGGYGGCYGGYGSYGCSGGYGGCSGGYATMGYGCSGYSGYSGFGCTGYGGGYGCSGYGGGGYGCSGYSGGGYGCGGYGGGVIVNPGMGGIQPEPLQAAPKKTTSAPAPATILVTLPAKAKLTIDGSPTTSSSGTRTFVSPPFARGSTYIYTLRAQLNGQTQSQDIRVRPGEVSQAQFTFPTSTVAGR